MENILLAITSPNKTVQFLDARERCIISCCIDQKQPTQDSGTETNDMCNTVQVVNHNVAEPTTYLNVDPGKVRYMDNEETIYALLDQGSTSSFCDKGLANYYRPLEVNVPWRCAP